MGEGWWIASDGKWYPGNTHPDALASGLAARNGDIAPADGWWQASDGNWYAPELHPDNIATITLSRRASPRPPVGMGASQTGPTRYGPSLPGYPAVDAAGGSLVASNGSALAANGTLSRLNGSSGANHLMLEAGDPSPVQRRDCASLARDPGFAGTGEAAQGSHDRRRGPIDRRGPITDRRAGTR